MPETCDVIYRKLSPHYLKSPQTEAEWMQISLDFEHLWQFPNCLGAIDGKHIRIRPPPNSGSHYYNYKKFHSIVLMAVADANLMITYIDVGENGRMSDGGIWGRSSLKSALDHGRLNIPVPKPLTHEPQGRSFPFTFIGDAAFGLGINMMRAFPGENRDIAERVFDYRLSRARRVVENVFGLLSSRFQVLDSGMRIHPDKVVKVVKATCVLHNLLRSKVPQKYSPEYQLSREDLAGGIIHPLTLDGSGAGAMVRLRNVGTNSTRAAREVRKRLRDYFMGPGAVSWQMRMV